MIMHGDCLDVMASMDAGSVDLIYADPPFNSGRKYRRNQNAFSDKFVSTAAYVEFIHERLVAMKRILKPTGSIYVHVDDTACHRVRCAMDDVFGDHAFRSQIIWRRSKHKNDAINNFPRVLDHILNYADKGHTFNMQFKPLDKEYIVDFYRYDDGDGRGKYGRAVMTSYVDCNYHYSYKGYKPNKNGWQFPIETMEKLDKDNRIYYPADKNKRLRKKIFLNESKGNKIPNYWDDIKFETGLKYPTQKPLALLERIISASSNVGDLVFDPFMGSGTTLVAAKRLGRRYAGCDISQDAIDVANKRLETENERLL